MNQNNAAHIAALEDLRLGVELDRHHLDDGDAKLAALDAALALLSKLRAPVAEETYTDDNGTVWTQPTAEAYAKACKALNKCRRENPQAKPAGDERMRAALDLGRAAEAAEAAERAAYTDPLSDFQEGQWWVKELDELARAPGATHDQKRAVAVVHHMLRSAALASAPVAGEAQGADRMAVLYVAGAICRHLDMALDQSKVMAAARDIAQRFAAPQASEAVRDALWTLTEHNALHFGEQHNTVIQGRAALSAQPGAQRTGGSDAN